jgi:serine/threonine protein kinase
VSEPKPLPEGTVVAGKLRVVRLLGMGGMGAVYEVEHQLTKHRRALKLLHPEMLEHPVVVARFLREASAAGRIGNSHVVETFDAGTLESGEPYLVMELLQGKTLAAKLDRQRRLKLGEIVDLVGQACSGVAAAHAAGIVHRDLKPENLFVIESDGKPFVKILDFGISKFDKELTGTHGDTKEGTALGTPYYMSPEQVSGDKELDARTDIYALGVILYECSSGKRPFVADALPKLSVLIHEGKAEPLDELRPDLPAGFVEVVKRAMAKDPDARFPSVRELAAALVPFGGLALDETIPEPTRGVSPSEPPRVDAKAASVAGSAMSIGDEKRPRSRAVIAGVLGGAMIVGAALYVAVQSNKSVPTVPTAPAASPPPVMPLPSSPVTLAPAPSTSGSPSASASTSASTSATTSATTSTEASAPAGLAATKPGTAAPSTAPAASKRSDQTGLAPSPFHR